MRQKVAAGHHAWTGGPSKFECRRTTQSLPTSEPRDVEFCPFCGFNLTEEDSDA